MAGLFEQKVEIYLDKIRKENKKINAILKINENAIRDARIIDENFRKSGKKGRLYGYVIGIKSNINVIGMTVNCASKTLENYESGYDASAIEKIKAEDGVIIGMLNMDEFACGSSGETSAFGFCENPAAPGFIPGGSSSGSAAAVAAGFCDMSLGSDTGGSIRNPASFCGVVGVKPSYGLVSRYGLIDLSMSLDQIGTLAKNVDNASLLLDVIRGKDDRDTQSFESNNLELKNPGRVKIGILRADGVDRKIQEMINKCVEKICKTFKWGREDVKAQHINLAIQTYYPLVYIEFYSATRRFDGRRYGHKIEDNCGEEVLRRILGGEEITKSEFRGTYYKKAIAAKEAIKGEFEDIFKRVDCIIMPTVPGMPWKVGHGRVMRPEEIYAYDALTVPANLAGICSISIPCGKIDGIPIGMQIMCARGEDAKMLSIAREIEKILAQ